MHGRHPHRRLTVVLTLALVSVVAGAGEPLTPGHVVTDFGAPPQFTFLGWDNRVKAAQGAVEVNAPNGQGGLGYPLKADLSAFAERTPALTVTVGTGNQAKAILVALHDADDTAHQFTLRLDGIGPGATATVTAEDGASLREPGTVSKAGKQEGFDLANVRQLIVMGNWTPAPVDITLRRLELIEPTPQILAAREGLRKRLAREAEQRRQAEEARAKRKQELLAGAPHPPDGPEVRHIGPAAPDLLVLRIQEKEFIPVPQIPYEPQPGDEVKREGRDEDKVLVVEDGQVRESLMNVVVYRKGARLGNLAVNAKMLKPDDKAVGQDLTVETVDEPSAYRIVGLDDPAWREPAAPASVSWKRKPNAFQSKAFQVHVFLKLPRPLADGKRYRIEFPGVNLRQASVEYVHEPSRTRSEAVHVSAIGFRPDDPFKRGFLSLWLGTGGAHHYAEGLRFHLLDDGTGRAVFDGAAKLLKGADEKEAFKAGRNYSKTDVLGLDFSSFKTSGRYRLYVEDVGCSYPFEIADDVWLRAFQLSMRGLLHHRGGIELGPPFTDYRRPRNMHPADGVKVFASEVSDCEGACNFKELMKRRTDRIVPDAWGGHMDAGDWDRNSAHPAAMWVLLDLYELFPERIGKVKLALPPIEAANAIPDILDEVLWNLDLHRRLQTPEGGVSGGIESTQHPRPGEGSWQESLLLSAYAPDPRSSFIYAASAAKLARLLAAHDKALAATYAASARKAWDWAATQAAPFLGRFDGKRREEIAAGFRDPRNLAAFELWRLTGEAGFHDEFKATTLLLGGPGDVNTQIKAIVAYARLADGQGDAALRDKARQWVLDTAAKALAFADGNAFGVTTWVPLLPPIGFVGYLSTPEMIGAVLPHAWLLTRDPKYLAAAVRACQFSAGANPDNRALTMSLGPDPVRFPLHIDSWVTGQPAPAGITVYGISDPAENFGFDAWAHTWYLQKMVPGSRTWPAHESYWDIYLVPSTNEYTIHQTIIPTAFYWGFLAARDN
ncbi:MAG TPA: glycoside hydrolase family 9 protein [Planctomycetota bacterium]|nr:glycoside hydrolase family 9 protein [Planctomycetota bacterium]HRT94807.1 glycoside hydrolase family 9 protein [Planctomycetota bacterium]